MKYIKLRYNRTNVNMCAAGGPIPSGYSSVGISWASLDTALSASGMFERANRCVRYVQTKRASRCVRFVNFVEVMFDAFGGFSRDTYHFELSMRPLKAWCVRSREHWCQHCNSGCQRSKLGALW